MQNANFEPLGPVPTHPRRDLDSRPCRLEALESGLKILGSYHRSAHTEVVVGCEQLEDS